LNHVAETVALPSLTRAVSICRRPRRRFETDNTSPEIATSSSAWRSAIRFSGTGSS
jgi:hypothetical protein